MRVSGDVADHDLVLNTINHLGLASAHGGACQELVPGRNVDKCDRVQLWMNFSFHGRMPSKYVRAGCRRLTLARLKTRIGLADYIDTALTTHNLAVGVTVLERFK